MGLLNYDKLFKVEKKNNVENVVLLYLAYYLVNEILVSYETI